MQLCRLVTSCANRTIRVWNLRTFECVSVIATQESVHGFAFAFDGVHIVAGQSKSVCVWSINTGQFTYVQTGIRKDHHVLYCRAEYRKSSIS